MIKFDGIISPIFSTGAQVYEEPSKQFRKVEKVKDFISETTEISGVSSTQSGSQPQYIGQDYSETYGQQVGELEAQQMQAEEDYEFDVDDEATIRESCVLLDDILTNAEDLDTLKGEIAMEMINSHEDTLKRLKILFKNHEQNGESKQVMEVFSC